jgi:outer membrane lipoprotein carrier protein
MKRLLTAVVIAASATASWADGLKSLEAFMKNSQAGRAEFTKPFEQTIVADGKTLWLYDADLNQVTQRPQAQALGSTPAAILASASDLKALSADFDLQSAPEQDGLQWVQANPRDRNGQLKSVRVGFASDGQLAALDILDSFGQRSLIRFTQLQTQASLPASTFEFKVPAGADVLKQ